MEADTKIKTLVQDIEKKSNSFFLQKTLDEIFKTSSETIVDTPEKRTLLFKRLSPLLGEELVERSLNLLDTWNITYYHPRNNIRTYFIVEWSCRRNSQATSYRIVPGTNYCKCHFFQTNVLMTDDSEDSKEAKDSTPSQASPPIRLTPVSYTCEHILGQRIHKVLMEPQEEIITNEQYIYMLKSIYN